jgi:ferritin-like metal-binding protein YciE
MAEMKNLRDLLVHELEDLYSAEEQIIDGLPAMIEKAENPELKKALNEHLSVTKDQKERLDNIKEILGSGSSEEKGFFEKLFTGSGEEHCEAMAGLIEEAEKTMDEEMEPEVMDAAIIASAQKIEHYEISSYGTARAFAIQLGLNQVVRLLEETLNEEYEADDLLTELAIGEVNLEAEGDDIEGEEDIPNVRKMPATKRSQGNKKSSGSKTSTAKKSSGSKSSSGRSAKPTSKSGGRTTGRTNSRSKTKSSSSSSRRKQSR